MHNLGAYFFCSIVIDGYLQINLHVYNYAHKTYEYAFKCMKRRKV